MNSWEVLGFCLEKKINLSLIVTIILFFLGYTIAKIVETSKQRSIRRQYLRALLQEISLNVESIEKGIESLPSLNDLYNFVRDGYKLTPPVCNRPVITFSYFDAVFKARVDVVQDLNYILIKNIVSFYGKMDALAIDVKSIESKGYETISLIGKDELFAEIKQDLQACSALGKAASDGIRLFLKIPSAGV